jgi:hypothetical protein
MKGFARSTTAQRPDVRGQPDDFEFLGWSAHVAAKPRQPGR